MKEKWIVLLLWITAGPLYSQEGDSLQPRILEEIVFVGVMPESDTLQNFYRANASATTENILARMNGVSLVRRGAFGQEPVFRGMQAGQLNVTLDGMKLFGACTDRMDPVTIYVEPQNLSAIQALPGTAGAEFGSTFGGTLNLTLASPVIREKAVTGRAGLDYQSAAHALNMFSHANISAHRSAWRISATYRKAGNYRAGGQEEIPYSQYEKVNVGASGKWTLSDHDTLQADAIFDQGYHIGFPALPMDVGKATASLLSLTWHRVARWHFLHHLRAKAYHNAIHHEMDDTQRKDITYHMDMPGSSRTTGFFAEGEISASRRQATKVKIEYFVNRLLGEMTMYASEAPPMYMQTAPLSERHDAAVFLSQPFRINERNRMEVSLRGDIVKDHLGSGIGEQQWEVFYPAMASKTSLAAGTASLRYTWKPRPHVKVEVLTGYGQRLPTLNERYGYYLFNRFDGYDYLGDPFLKKETSVNTEATFHYFGENIELQLNPFSQRIYHYIAGRIAETFETMTPGAAGVKQYANTRYADIRGFDAMALARPHASLQAIASLKYTYGKSAAREPLPLIPPLKSVASLRYQWRHVYAQAEWEWATAQKHAASSAGEQTTPSWNTLAFRTGWTINSFLQCNAGVENMLDRHYREHLDWGGIPRPGRNFYFNAIYTF